MKNKTTSALQDAISSCEELYWFIVDEIEGTKVISLLKVEFDENNKPKHDLIGESTYKIGTLDEIRQMILDYFKENDSNVVVALVDRIHRSKLMIKEKHDVEKIKIRKYVRFDAMVKYQVRMTDDEEGSLIDIDPDHIINLSLGGILFYARTKIPTGIKLSLTFDLEDFGIFDATGSVVRSVPETDEPGLFAIAIEFDALNDEQREKIISYLMTVRYSQSE